MTEASGPHESVKRRPDWPALCIALALLVLAAIIAWDASRLSGAATYARIGPQTFPVAIAICLAVLGVWCAIEAWRGDFPEREPQEYRNILWVVGGLILQIILLLPTGFSIATGLMFAAVARGFGERRLWLTIPAGIVFAFVVWFIFARGLQLTLPAGPIENAVIAALTRPS